MHSWSISANVIGVFEFKASSAGLTRLPVGRNGRSRATSWQCDFFNEEEDRLNELEPVATLVIDFDANGRVVGQHLNGSVHGITASQLSRLPWTRLIRMAKSERSLQLNAVVNPDKLEHDGASSTLRRLAQAKASVAEELTAMGESVNRVKRRPGRGGHPDEFYEAIALRYSALVAEGVTNPVQVIAEEESNRKESVSRNTVSTWIKRCRERGLLPSPGGKPSPSKGKPK